MMDVIFCLDARTVHPHFPGVGRYTANLARAMVSCLDRSERLVVLRDPRQQAAVVAAGERVRAFLGLDAGSTANDCSVGFRGLR